MDDFEKDFVNQVNLATQAERAAVEESKAEMAASTQTSAKPIVSATIVSTPETPEPNADVSDNKTKNKLMLFMTLTIVFAVIAICLSVVLFISKIHPSITGNVRLNNLGKVEAIGVYCEMDDQTVYLTKANNYFIEITNLQDALIEIKPGVYEQLDDKIESGKYIIDGNTIHFLPDGDENGYYAEYSSQKLTLDGRKYQCENYD